MYTVSIYIDYIQRTVLESNFGTPSPVFNRRVTETRGGRPVPWLPFEEPRLWKGSPSTWVVKKW